MGMAASQARLLCITARISDVEYQAQSIQHAKLQLATQSDQAYQDYLEALDAQSLVLCTVNPTNGEKSTVTATFNNLCSINRLNPAANGGYEYALKDAKGRLIVEDEVAAGYQDFIQNCDYKNAEAFAMYMIYGKDITKKAEDAEKSALNNIENPASNLADTREAIMNMLGAGAEDVYDTINLKPEDKSRYEQAMSYYRELLYKHNGAEVATAYNNTPVSKEDFDKKHSDFNYYVSIYNQIEANGGSYIAISKFDGFKGTAANDSEWLTAMVQSGLITIDMVKKDAQGRTVFNGTSPSSDTSISYKETTKVDSTAAKKAEIKYENELSNIQAKDKKYDLSLSKLEAEREALTKQRDSLNKVIKENIEKSFGIFS